MLCCKLRKCITRFITDEMFHTHTCTLYTHKSLYARVARCEETKHDVSVSHLWHHILSVQSAAQKRWRRNIKHCSGTHTSLYAKVFPHAAAPECNTAAGETDLFTCWPISDNNAFLFGSRLMLLPSSLLCSKIKKKRRRVNATVSALLPFLHPAFPFANHKSLPHLPQAPSFLFSADAAGSKIRQQLWLMCGYNMADSDHWVLSVSALTSGAFERDS